PAARGAQIVGDALALRRLFANVIDNALAYGREARISADVEGDQLIVLIDDKGPGISLAEREMVFEPFVRLEQSRSRATGGAGLGLAIARNVAETHGGLLTLQEAPGGGTRAVVTLPLFMAGVRCPGSDTAAQARIEPKRYAERA
ncbi:MAG: hypothetical protein J2P50_19135, partial [Hyphomicrobiaceae bacterium]|nr:hypothetical protein [Hyphomicrobiaceae bacterium]